MVNYDAYAKTFSNSRKNMKWEEIEYFLSFLGNLENKNILDVGCGNGRLIHSLQNHSTGKFDYIGIDASEGLIQEASNLFPQNTFYITDMKSMEQESKLQNISFDIIFFIASFHHLLDYEARKNVLLQARNLLKAGGVICMTNWALESPLNKEKYQKSYREGSMNQYGSKDFDIKIGEHLRFYHSFSLQELNILFADTGLVIVENRLFDTEKNIISIMKK